MSWQASDNERRREGLVRYGRVTEVDPAKARARVTFGGESKSAWLPWLAQGAGTVSAWSPPAVGEQVVVMAQSGDTAQAVIVGSVFSGQNRAPSDDGGMYRIKLGMSSITMTDSQITLHSNGSTLTLDASGAALNGARIDLN